jgi:hypothetical protein
MARPPLRPEERRDDRLPNLRVTAAERALIEEKAAAAGLTLVEYCRRAIFKSRIAPKRGNTDQALLVELNRVGVNLNQIAHRVNAGRSLSPEFPSVLDEVRAAIKKVLADGS